MPSARERRQELGDASQSQKQELRSSPTELKMEEAETQQEQESLTPTHPKKGRKQLSKQYESQESEEKGQQQYGWASKNESRLRI